MTLVYLLIAGRVIRDEFTGLFSFIDIFEAIPIPKNEPKIFRSFAIIGKISGVPIGQHTVKVIVLKPDGSEHTYNPFTTNVARGGDLQLAAGFNLVTFEIPGKYTLKVNIDGNELEDVNKFYFQVIKEQ